MFNNRRIPRNRTRDVSKMIQKNIYTTIFSSSITLMWRPVWCFAVTCVTQIAFPNERRRLSTRNNKSCFLIHKRSRRCFLATVNFFLLFFFVSASFSVVFFFFSFSVDPCLFSKCWLQKSFCVILGLESSRTGQRFLCYNLRIWCHNLKRYSSLLKRVTL